MFKFSIDSFENPLLFKSGRSWFSGLNKEVKGVNSSFNFPIALFPSFFTAIPAKDWDSFVLRSSNGITEVESVLSHQPVLKSHQLPPKKTNIKVKRMVNRIKNLFKFIPLYKINLKVFECKLYFV